MKHIPSFESFVNGSTNRTTKSKTRFALNEAWKPVNQQQAQPDVLKDVNSTAKALEAVDIGQSVYSPRSSQGLSEAYHKAKKDKSNPELVEAVEDLLGAKAEPITEKTGTKSGRAEYGKMKDSFFGGMEPNKNRLFFTDATNDFQYRGDSRADIVLMLDGANFWLTEGPDGYVTIEDFQVSEDKLGTGKGKFALSKLIEYADRNGITLIGEPLAQAERKRGVAQKGLSQKQLIEFYKKNGFEKISKDSLSKNRTAEANYLERKPKDIRQNIKQTMKHIPTFESFVNGSVNRNTKSRTRFALNEAWKPVDAEKLYRTFLKNDDASVAEDNPEFYQAEARLVAAVNELFKSANPTYIYPKEYVFAGVLGKTFAMVGFENSGRDSYSLSIFEVSRETAKEAKKIFDEYKSYDYSYAVTKIEDEYDLQDGVDNRKWHFSYTVDAATVENVIKQVNEIKFTA